MNHLSDRQLKFAEFVVKHEYFWKRFPVFLLFFITFLIISGLGLRWLVYTNETVQDLIVQNSLTVDYIPYAQIRDRLSPQNIQVGTVGGVYAGSAVDAYGELYNPNEKWTAHTVKVRFLVNGIAMDEQTIFLLPKQRKNIMHFNIPTATPNALVQLEVVDVGWIRARNIELLQALNDLAVENIQFANNTETGAFEATGQLVNRSGYGFWNVGFQVLVLKQSQVIGINYVTLDEVRIGQIRPVTVSWPATIPGVDEVRIIPDVNVLDESVYITGSGQYPIDPSGID